MRAMEAGPGRRATEAGPGRRGQGRERTGEEVWSNRWLSYHNKNVIATHTRAHTPNKPVNRTRFNESTPSIQHAVNTHTVKYYAVFSCAEHSWMFYNGSENSRTIIICIRITADI